jgi:hypothetical protein
MNFKAEAQPKELKQQLERVFLKGNNARAFATQKYW